jgi:hypothetical protein
MEIVKKLNILENEKGNKKIRLIALNLFIFIVSVYFLTASGPHFYNEFDAWRIRFELVKSIAERFDLAIGGNIGTMGIDGREYSVGGIGWALVAVPFYIFAELIGIQPEIVLSIINQLFCAVTVVLVFLFSISLGYSRRTSLLVAIFYGLGTIAWPQAKHPFGHPLETFFLLLSVYLLYSYISNRKNLYLLLSAFSMGFAFITRPTSILVIPPLCIMIIVYFSKQFSFRETVKLITKNVALFSLVFLPFLGLFLWCNYYRFGSIFETGYHLISARTGINFFTGTSVYTGLSGLLLSPGKGFFYYSPIAVLFIFSIKPFLKKHLGLGICFICIIVSYLLFLSRYVFWHGDWTWGPRFMLVLTPFFIMPIAELIDSKTWRGKRFLRTLVCSIFVLSLIIQIAAVSVDFRKYFFNLYIEEDVNFVVARGNGVQSIHEPPSEIYFDWHKSPILAQFRFINTIAKGIKNYKNTSLPSDATDDEKIKANPIMNIYDFWWLYNYFLDRSYSGIFVALVLLMLAVSSAIRLWKISC